MNHKKQEATIGATMSTKLAMFGKQVRLPIKNECSGIDSQIQATISAGLVDFILLGTTLYPSLITYMIHGFGQNITVITFQVPGSRLPEVP